MNNEEAQKILDSMRNVMPENLTGEAKKIFEAIMVIADGRDKAYKELEEKDKIINAMAEYIATLDIDEDICKKMGIFKNCEIKDVENCKKCIIKYFREKYK